MSEGSTPVTEERYRYLAKRTAQEGFFLHNLEAGVHAEGIPPIWIFPEQGQFKANIADGHPSRIKSRLNSSCLTRNGPDTTTYGTFEKTPATLRYGEGGC